MRLTKSNGLVPGTRPFGNNAGDVAAENMAMHLKDSELDAFLADGSRRVYAGAACAADALVGWSSRCTDCSLSAFQEVVVARRGCC